MITGPSPQSTNDQSMLKVKDLGRMESDNIDSTNNGAKDGAPENGADESEDGKIFPGGFMFLGSGDSL